MLGTVDNDEFPNLFNPDCLDLNFFGYSTDDLNAAVRSSEEKWVGKSDLKKSFISRLHGPAKGREREKSNRPRATKQCTSKFRYPRRGGGATHLSHRRCSIV